MIRKFALRAACTLFVSFSVGTGTALAAANPLGLAFSSTTNVERYGKATGMLITGRCNKADSKFAAARAKGGEVLVYINPSERPDRYICAQDEKFYMGDRGRVPLWPYPSYGQRQNYGGTKLTDMRPGSPWILHVVKQVETLMREGKVDGVFLDVVGGQLWTSLANWNSWSQTEKNLWTDGNIDLVKRIDAKRRAINPMFIVVNNNVWKRNGDERGQPGERYVDGIMLEHHKYSSTWHKNYISRKFSDLGQRRVFVIANSTSEALLWAKVPGVTHVSDQKSSQYRYPNLPVVPFSYRGDRD
ncbi:MAG TPA: hypothetical protein VNA21_14335 [Steroidobacteraceae bacterium]|nr:hypothetical protein [Steroidobacteraceae bacterium]